MVVVVVVVVVVEVVVVVVVNKPTKHSVIRLLQPNINEDHHLHLTKGAEEILYRDK